jgi:rRNA-processing protein FCF1
MAGVTDLLAGTKQLLLELVGDLDQADSHLPTVRIAGPGRHGVRCWHWGAQKRELDGRKQPAQFDELRAAGYLRELRKGNNSGEVFYAFTPAAFQLRDQELRRSAPSPARTRPVDPPPEITDALCGSVRLRQLAEAARDSLLALAKVSPINTFRNDPSSGVVIIPRNPFSWRELSREDIPLLGAARHNTEAWLDGARRVLAVAAPEHLGQFDELADDLRTLYIRGEDSTGPNRGSQERIGDDAQDAVNLQLGLIERLPGAVEPSRLIVMPDTNALLQDPAIEDWVLVEGNEPVTIVIAQIVVTELDRKKIDGNASVARKAESLIRRFDEYGRRGDTLAPDGVRLRGSVRFRELPLAPNMSLMPGGLDPAHADDCALAAAISLTATHLSSRIVLVTRDRNLRNKARRYAVPAVDVSRL